MSGVEVEVRDESPCAPRLARLAQEVLVEAAPRLEEITGLVMPSVTFRLVTAWVWRAEVVAYVDRSVRHALAYSEVFARERAEAEDKVASWRKAMARSWPLFEARTLTAADGRSQTLIAPRALHTPASAATVRRCGGCWYTSASTTHRSSPARARSYRLASRCAASPATTGRCRPCSKATPNGPNAAIRRRRSAICRLWARCGAPGASRTSESATSRHSASNSTPQPSPNRMAPVRVGL